MIPSQRQEQTPRTDLFMLEKKILASTDVFCRMLWQESSKQIRSKYRRFSLSAKEFKRAIEMYDMAVDHGSAFTMSHFVHEILEPIGRSASLPGELWEDTCSADTTLSIASYTGCRLGGDASSGDLELFFRLHGLERIQTEFAKGNFLELYVYLNDKLNASVQELAKLNLSKGNRSIVSHAPSMWSEPRKGGFEIDANVIKTEYHLYTSLLRYVEGISGSA